MKGLWILCILVILAGCFSRLPRVEVQNQTERDIVLSWLPKEGSATWQVGVASRSGIITNLPSAATHPSAEFVSLGWYDDTAVLRVMNQEGAVLYSEPFASIDMRPAPEGSPFRAWRRKDRMFVLIVTETDIVKAFGLEKAEYVEAEYSRLPPQRSIEEVQAEE